MGENTSNELPNDHLCRKICLSSRPAHSGIQPEGKRSVWTQSTLSGVAKIFHHVKLRIHQYKPWISSLTPSCQFWIARWVSLHPTSPPLPVISLPPFAFCHCSSAVLKKRGSSKQVITGSKNGERKAATTLITAFSRTHRGTV